MPETDDSVPQSPAADLREIVLRIPGEHFFCETIDVPRNLDPEELTSFAEQALGEEGLSPFPIEQEAWGFYASLEHGKMLLFATSLAKLRQDGWQNLEGFRRVFPSFVSFLGKEYERPTICLLRHEETLTGFAYEQNCPVPSMVFSLPLTPEEEEEDRFDETRGKLLALFDLELFEIEPVVYVTGDARRANDGTFHFEHFTAGGDSDDLPSETTKIDADLLWTCDVRSGEFKVSEQSRREWERRRWVAFLAWGVGVAALVVAFVGSKVFEKKSDQKDLDAQAMAAEVPLVEESRKLLEKLRQNKLGGIDPFGSLGRLSTHRGGEGDQPFVWFTAAHFASRNEIVLEGQGRNVESVNNFIKAMEESEIGYVMEDKGGDKKRKINSTLGKTTFTIELMLLEEKKQEEASVALPETPEVAPEGG